MYKSTENKFFIANKVNTINKSILLMQCIARINIVTMISHIQIPSMCRKTGIYKHTQMYVYTLLYYMINPLNCFFGSEGHVALDRNSGPGYTTLLFRLIPGDLLSTCPHRQFHTLPSLLNSRAALSNSYPNALRVMQGGSLYNFFDGLWYDPVGRRTHDLPCERRTR